MTVLGKISRGAGVLAVGVLFGGAALAQASRFTYSADGAEVTDNRTGLVWQRCSAGQTWSGSACIGTAATYTHEAALSYAQSQTGWRLPNVKELGSLVDRTQRDPAIDSTAFPGTVSGWYWTASPYAGAANQAWLVDFGLGFVNGSYRYDGFHVRLVR